MTEYLGRGLFDEDSYGALENKVLLAITSHYASGEALLKIKELLTTLDNYEEKVEKLFELLPENKQRYKPFFPTYVKTTIQRGYAFKTSKVPQSKIKAECLLCKAADAEIKKDLLSEDYNLSNYLENPLKIVELSGTHVTILENPDLAKHINDFL